MEEKISLCGDNCSVCPRYIAQSEEALNALAELWHRIGWRDRILSGEEMRCAGCSADKRCGYGLIECTQKHHVRKCCKCPQFPCEKIRDVLNRSNEYRARCEKLCTAEEYAALEQAFFHKETYLTSD